jgi:hypothetical protein
MEMVTMSGLDITKYAEIGRKMRDIPLDKSGPRYEWEELVQKLCASDDVWLHDIGIKELGELKYNQKISKEK